MLAPSVHLNQVSLPCSDVARAAEFYLRMGFRQIVAHLPDYARFECPKSTATFSLHRVDAAPAGGEVIVYFECEDLDLTVQRLLELGLVIDAQPADQPWLWREAHLRDPDGNRICLYHAGANRRFPPWRLPPDEQVEPLSITIEEEPDGPDVQVLADGLTAHALPVVGRPGFRQLGVFARDAKGSVVGGIAALTNWEWLHINLVWVDESLRGTGLGHRLLETVEAAARERGCRWAHLDTFSYQARPFYERHGYQLFATLEDYPRGHQRFFLRKALGGIGSRGSE